MGDKYFYQYVSRMFKDEEFELADTLAKSTAGAWLTQDDRGRRLWVMMSAEAGRLESDRMGAFTMISGGGYGVRVFDANGNEVGHAYATYPRCCGIATYCGKLMWPRGVGMDEPFLAPETKAALRDATSVTEFHNLVSRLGDPYPIPKMANYANLNALNSSFIVNQ